MEQTKHICRLCLDPNPDVISSISIKNTEMRSKLDIVFNFKLNEQESLPTGICQGCSSKVAEFYSFHEYVRTNQDKLQDSLVDEKLWLVEMVKVEPVEPTISSYTREGESTNWDESVSDCADEIKEESSDSDTSESSKESLAKKRKKISRTSRPKPKSESSEEKLRRLAEENRKILEFYSMNCEFCSETFEAFELLQRHTRKMHGVRKSINCCGRSFHRKCKIIQHIDIHLNPNQFRCELCNKSYTNKYYLEVHNLQKHKTDQDEVFKCEKCGRGFPREYLLKSHLNTHVQAQCTVCHRVLANAFTLRVHMTKMHSKDSQNNKGPDQICETCGKKFRTKSAMELHMNKHMGIQNDERTQCHICNQWLSSKRCLRIHINTVHSGKNQSLPCDICQQTYPSPVALKRHKKRVHIEEKFECDYCGKKFKRSINLKEHLASHTGETLYSCNVCGMTTNSNGNLYSHKKSKHPDEWLEAKRKALAKPNE